MIKIDIEGFEEDLFSINTSWLDVFQVMIIEIHDWLIPRMATSSNLLKCLAKLNRDLIIHGENFVSIKN